MNKMIHNFSFFFLFNFCNSVREKLVRSTKILNFFVLFFGIFVEFNAIIWLMFTFMWMSGFVLVPMHVELLCLYVIQVIMCCLYIVEKFNTHTHTHTQTRIYIYIYIYLYLYIKTLDTHNPTKQNKKNVIMSSSQLIFFKRKFISGH